MALKGSLFLHHRSLFPPQNLASHNFLPPHACSLSDELAWLVSVLTRHTKQEKKTETDSGLKTVVEI